MISYSTSQASTGANSTSQTIAYTQPADTNALLVVGVWRSISGGSITNMKWDGVAMTLIDTTAGGITYFDMYFLLAPHTGTLNLTFTIANVGTPNVIFVSYAGVKQSGQPDAHIAVNTTADPATGTLTIGAKGAWSIYGGGVPSHEAAGTNVTQRAATVDGSSRPTTLIGDSNGIVSLGSYSQSISNPVGSNFTGDMASFAPDSYTPPQNMFLVF